MLNGVFPAVKCSPVIWNRLACQSQSHANRAFATCVVIKNFCKHYQLSRDETFWRAASWLPPRHLSVFGKFCRHAHGKEGMQITTEAMERRTTGGGGESPGGDISCPHCCMQLQLSSWIVASHLHRGPLSLMSVFSVSKQEVAYHHASHV